MLQLLLKPTVLTTNTLSLHEQSRKLCQILNYLTYRELVRLVCHGLGLKIQVYRVELKVLHP